MTSSLVPPTLISIDDIISSLNQAYFWFVAPKPRLIYFSRSNSIGLCGFLFGVMLSCLWFPIYSGSFVGNAHLFLYPLCSNIIQLVMWTNECGDSNPRQQPLKVWRFLSGLPWDEMNNQVKKLKYFLIQMGSEPWVVAEWYKVGQTLKKSWWCFKMLTH